MLAIRLKADLEDRLSRLARWTGRPQTFYAREAIEQHIDDLEDYYLAADALKDRGRTYSAEGGELLVLYTDDTMGSLLIREDRPEWH